MMVACSKKRRCSIPPKVLSYFCSSRPTLGLLPLDNFAVELIETRSRGALVAASDDAFVELGHNLCCEAPLARDIGAGGREDTETLFDPATIADEFKGLFWAALVGPRRTLGRIRSHQEEASSSIMMSGESQQKQKGQIEDSGSGGNLHRTPAPAESLR